MTPHYATQNQPIRPESILKPLVVGAGIALLLISFFVFGVDAPPPEWGAYWRFRPLLITPLAGALGGAFYGLMNALSLRGFNRTLAVILSILVYAIGLWLGTVLGLAGTMWD